MVGVKKYDDEAISFILACKANGKRPNDIVELCKAKWPRKDFKESGIKYVCSCYGNDPKYVNPPPCEKFMGPDALIVTKSKTKWILPLLSNPEQTQPSLLR